MLTSLLIAAAALAPGVTTAPSDDPPDILRKDEVVLVLAIGGDVICPAYTHLVDITNPALSAPVEGFSFSMLDAAAIVMAEEAYGGRMTDAARHYFVDWLHSC